MESKYDDFEYGFKNGYFRGYNDAIRDIREHIYNFMHELPNERTIEISDPYLYPDGIEEPDIHIILKIRPEEKLQKSEI
jgi:hypothetical protein